MGHPMMRWSEGKTVYWVRGQHFMNDTGLRNGKKRAVDYCLMNDIPQEEIITFDSQLECERYEYLLTLQEQGTIQNLKHHLSLPMIPEYKNYNGDIIPEARYNADFTYYENGKRVVEDVKGASLFQDSRFEIVKQIFDYIYREKTYIRIIIRRDHQWIEWHLGEIKKSRKLIQKQSAKNKELQAELHKKEMEANKLERDKQSYLRFKAMPSLTSAQKKRLLELEAKLKEKGVII